MTVPAGFGVVFDWDGVVIDSEDYHRRSWNQLANEETDLALKPGDFEASFGMRNEQIIPHVFKWADPNDTDRINRLADRKEGLYRQLIRTEGIEPLPGVVSLLEQLRAANVPTAVGSSTPRANIDAVMQAIGVTDHFQAIVAAGDVTNGKPDPEVFLTAAQRIACHPESSIVIEDAQVGIRAGKAGGFHVLAVATSHKPDELTEADACHPDLSSVTLDILLQLAAQ